MHSPSNLPDSSGIFHANPGGGWDLNNAPPLLIQIAERMDTQGRAHYALQQEVVGLRHELRNLDKLVSTAQNNQDQIRDSVGRLGERIGAVEAGGSSSRTENEAIRRAIEDLNYRVNNLTEKFAGLDDRDNQQARELRAMREWQVRVVTIAGVVIPVLSFFGPQILSALLAS